MGKSYTCSSRTDIYAPSRQRTFLLPTRLKSKYGYYYTFTQDNRHRSYQHEADLNIFGWNDNQNLRANDNDYQWGR